MTRNRDLARFNRMDEMAVAARLILEKPTVPFQQPDRVPHLHTYTIRLRFPSAVDTQTLCSLTAQPGVDP